MTEPYAGSLFKGSGTPGYCMSQHTYFSTLRNRLAQSYTCTTSTFLSSDQGVFHLADTDLEYKPWWGCLGMINLLEPT